VSDNGKLEKPTQSQADTKVAQRASAEAPVGQGLREGAGYHAVLAERAQAIESIRYRVTRGVSGTPPAGHIAAERRAIIGAAAARIMRKQSGSATGGQVPKTTGAPLPADVKAKMEPKLGADLSSVKIHTGGESAQAASGFGARAFTVGSDVHFNAGEFKPGTKEGDRLLAHELAHVVQAQKSGVQRKSEEGEKADGKEGGGPEVSEPEEPAEKEADAVADGVAKNLHGDDSKEERGGEEAQEPGKKDGDAEKKSGAKVTSDAPGGQAPPIAAKLEPKIHAKLIYDGAVGWLSGGAGGKFGTLAAAEARANELMKEKDIQVVAEVPSVGAAAYSPSEKKIRIRPIEAKDQGQVKNLSGVEVSTRVTALTHELQHVCDHHSGEVNLLGALEDNDPWVHRIRSEWRAHASQAKAALEIKKGGGQIADRDELLLRAWGPDTFSIAKKDVTQSMFQITRSYIALYGPAKKMPSDEEVQKFVDKRGDWVAEAFAIFPADAAKSASTSGEAKK
jgi:hypothetical protein